MKAVELARFLLNLNVPDSEYDVIINQMRGLTRKAGERIQTVMSHLLALGNTMHKNLSEEEKNGKINTLMINGLLKFTTGQTKTNLAETVDDVNREQRKVLWEKFMNGVVKNESVHGYPTTALSYNEASGMTTRLFNVDTRAGLHVGTVGELVHQGLNLDEDYSLGRNTLLEQKPRRKTHELDIASVEDKLRLRNIELERREMLRQVAENRQEENEFAELRAATERRERRDSEARRAREFIANLARKPSKLSRSNIDDEEVFDEAQTEQEARRSTRERKQTDKYAAGGSGASVNAFDTRQNFDRDRRQSQSPNRQRSGSYDSKERNSRNDSRVDKERSQSDRSYKSSDRQSRQTSKEQYRPSRPDSRDRNSEKGRQSFDRQRSTSRDRQYSSNRNDRNDKSRASSYDSNKSKSYDSRQSRPADRASSYDRNRASSYDRNQSRSNDSRQSRPADRASSYDRNRNSSFDRNRSNERSRDSYRSSDQNRSRTDSRDRKSSFDRQRSNSRDRYKKQDSQGERKKDWSDQDWDKGNNCSRNYDPYREKNCWKCMKRGEHHEFECKLYDRISPRVCRVCEKGYHYDMECANRRDSRTNLLSIGMEKKI